MRAEVVRWAHRPDVPILFREEFLDALGDRGERKFGGRTVERRTDVPPVASVLIGDVGDDVVLVALRSRIDHQDLKAGRVIQRSVQIRLHVLKRSAQVNEFGLGVSSRRLFHAHSVLRRRRCHLRASTPSALAAVRLELGSGGPSLQVLLVRGGCSCVGVSDLVVDSGFALSLLLAPAHLALARGGTARALINFLAERWCASCRAVRRAVRSA